MVGYQLEGASVRSDCQPYSVNIGVSAPLVRGFIYELFIRITASLQDGGYFFLELISLIHATSTDTIIPVAAKTMLTDQEFSIVS